MEYRTANKTCEKLSILGYGCMRLPEKGGKIDEVRATKQLHYAIDHGVNYIDAAMPYHMGACEPFLGNALEGEYRKKVRIATKMPHWYVRVREDMDNILDVQLKNLRSSCIDYYLVHNMNGENWKRLKGLGFAKFVERSKKEGRIGRIGFSAHTSTEDFKGIINDYDWEFCQIQYNYLDENNQAGTEGLRYASSKGLGVVIMEPLRGGALGRKPPGEVQKIFDESKVKMSPAEWAFRWIWNHPEVTVVLSGMNDEKHIEDNIKCASSSKPNMLSPEELATIARVRDAYRRIMKVGCTGCRYCVPCPFGVNIPRCFELYNGKYLGTASPAGSPKIEYIVSIGDAFSGGKPGYASQCKNCKKCVNKCPQHLPIPALLANVKQEFEGATFPLLRFVVKNYLKFDRWRNMRRVKN